jgi:hypothetical protein
MVVTVVPRGWKHGASGVVEVVAVAVVGEEHDVDSG